jgi:hypothetical protein
MKIYTSYWAMVRNFPKNLVGLNTTVWPPKWRPLGQDKRGVWVIDCPPLKPGIECDGLCNGKCEPKHPKDCQFLQTYYNQLCKLDFNNFLSHLEKLKLQIENGEQLDDVSFALIVFETPTNPCSERWKLQNWLKENGIEVEEWQPNI